MGTTRQGTFIGLPLVLGFAVVCLLLAGIGRTAQTTPGTTPQAQELERLIYSVKGPDLFRAHCAACHGEDAKGNGPMAPALKTTAPDLTVLARNHGGQFPVDHVRKLIAGDEVLASHGSREMPIWGPIFHQIERDQDFGNVRLENLVKYLESIQASAASIAPAAPTPPTASSGAELYAQHCAACHGNDLKGTGPAPYPFREAPDLTTLARHHGGKFPDSYVSKVLREGVVMPAHGPAEMPIWGPDFTMDRLGEAQVALRISNLTNYIQSMQGK
jgi:mono/diheme cytochrome c family protein